MRLLKPILSLAITVSLIYALNQKWGAVPPFGKFLDPFHGFWQNAEGGLMPGDQLSIPGLKEEVTVVYDSLLIPHIFAKNDEDLYLAQGYVTAQHRLWQMEFQTHAGAGRISEIIGDAALDFDRTQRRLGMTYAAENSLKEMENDPIAKLMVSKYTEGINHFISSLDYEELPFEYKLLSYEPELWSNLKCGILLKNMAKTLNIGEKDLEMTNALKLFGKETVALLFPDQENVGDPIVDNADNWNFNNVVKLDSVPLAVPDELITKKPSEKPDKNVGSNNWALSGSKTATGSPILCNDPHLTLSLPSIWFAIHLNAPGVNVMGVSLPGAPAVIIGFNDSIAWGMTNAQRDLVDWYKIQFKDEKKNEYLSDGLWKPARKIVEEFKIKGKTSFYDTLVFTHHGPVTYDESFHADDEKARYSFRWIAHDPSEEILTFYKLNRATNHRGYMEALDHFSSPAQNFVFASASGDIAMRIQGKYPVRRPDEGKYVLDGTRTAYEWQAFIPYDQNVMYKNPERGFVSSANQYPVDNTYPYYVTANSYEAYRNRRINQVLSQIDNATPADMMELQFDTYNMKAAESLPFFLQNLDSTKLTAAGQEAFTILKAWDFYNNINSEGASYYEAWWDSLMPMVWDEMQNEKYALDYPTTFMTIKLLREKPDLSFFDIQSTPEKETAREVLQKSFSEGVARIEKWKQEKGKVARWADYKDTYIGHLLRQEALSVHLQHGGNHDIVNASTRTHGPSWRMIVSLEKTGTRAWAVYPGGQSGNPGSPFYTSMTDEWADGKYFKLNFLGAEQLAQHSIATTTLKPSAK